jgi:hypothetical protein
VSHHTLYAACITILGASWVVVYLAVIRAGFRERTYAMPLVALCGNLAWEFHFAYLAPYEPFQRSADTIWFLLDLAILWTVVRYGPQEFPSLPRFAFYALLGGGMAAAFSLIHLLARALGDSASIYTGFGDTLLMSATFIGMALGRGSLRGQSLLIAYTKWIGTAPGCVAYYFFDDAHPHIALIGCIGVLIFTFDGAYVAVLHHLRAHPLPAVIPLREPSEGIPSSAQPVSPR